MSNALRIHDLAPSPNNMKVRIGAHAKGVDYERVAVLPGGDRSGVVAATGQELTPALEHDVGGTTLKLFDSSAILRYLDANFPGPRLFPSDREGLREVEGWELYAQTQLLPPVAMVFGLFFAPEPNRAVAEEASRLMNTATARLETRLAESDWLVRDALGAADCACAPFVWYGMVPERAATPNSVAAFFREHLHLGEGRERTRAWANRAMDLA